jgi:hypothetical protein
MKFFLLLSDWSILNWKIVRFFECVGFRFHRRIGKRNIQLGPAVRSLCGKEIGNLLQRKMQNGSFEP